LAFLGRVFVCVCVWVCILMYMQVYKCVNSLYMCSHICMRMHTFTCVHICTYVYMHIYAICILFRILFMIFTHVYDARTYIYVCLYKLRSWGFGGVCTIYPVWRLCIVYTLYICTCVPKFIFIYTYTYT